MKTYLKSGIIAITLGLSFLSNSQLVAMDNTEMTTSSKAITESRFIEMMRMHHEDGVEMAQLAAEKSQSLEVKKISQKIIDAQTKEIAQFTKWQKRWYSNMDMKSDISNMTMPMMDTTALKQKTGKDFDSSYLNMMVTHHESAIQMARDVSDKLQHKEVKSLAEKIIKDQTAEIAKLKQIEKSL